MSDFFEQCRHLFGTDDLYAVLGVKKGCGQAGVKKGYKTTSLKCHPDRNSKDEQEVCTAKFQIVSKTYSILSDDAKRALYDDTGEVDFEEENLGKDDFEHWQEYWRGIFPQVTQEQLTSFEKSYKGSEKEVEDLKRLYLKFEGDMDKIMDNHIMAEFPEEQRIRDCIQSLIDDDEVPGFPDFLDESPSKRKKRKREWEKEQKEFKEQADSDLSSLVAKLKQQQQNRGASNDNFLDRLAEKYGSKQTKKTTKGKRKK